MGDADGDDGVTSHNGVSGAELTVCGGRFGDQRTDGRISDRVRPQNVTLSPETVPIMTCAPMRVSAARTVTSHDGTPRAGGKQKKAIPLPCFTFLTELLPPVRARR